MLGRCFVRSELKILKQFHLNVSFCLLQQFQPEHCLDDSRRLCLSSHFPHFWIFFLLLAIKQNALFPVNCLESSQIKPTPVKINHKSFFQPYKPEKAILRSLLDCTFFRISSFSSLTPCMLGLELSLCLKTENIE